MFTSEGDFCATSGTLAPMRRRPFGSVPSLLLLADILKLEVHEQSAVAKFMRSEPRHRHC